APALDGRDDGRVANEDVRWLLEPRAPDGPDHGGVVLGHVEDDGDAEALCDPVSGRREGEIAAEDQVGAGAARGAEDEPDPARVEERWEHAGGVDAGAEDGRKRREAVDMALLELLLGRSAVTVPGDEVHGVPRLRERSRDLLDTDIPRILGIPDLADPHEPPPLPRTRWRGRRRRAAVPREAQCKRRAMGAARSRAGGVRRAEPDPRTPPANRESDRRGRTPGWGPGSFVRIGRPVAGDGRSGRGPVGAALARWHTGVVGVRRRGTEGWRVEGRVAAEGTPGLNGAALDPPGRRIGRGMIGHAPARFPQRAPAAGGRRV